MVGSWTRCVARRAHVFNRIIPMKVILPALAALTLLSACAQKPEAVVARSVSPMMYSSLDCTALQAERYRIHSQVTNLTAAQKKKASNDAVAMGVGMVLFWPALFALSAGSDQAGDLAQAKGEWEATEFAMRQKNCG